jgi:uncharacterized protein
MVDVSVTSLPEIKHDIHERRNEEWDKAKKRTNIRKQGVDLAEAQAMFRGVLVADSDTREDYGERRRTGLVTIRGRTAHAAFTERNSEIIRIISLRRTTRRENEQYEKAIQDRMETA